MQMFQGWQMLCPIWFRRECRSSKQYNPRNWRRRFHRRQRQSSPPRRPWRMLWASVHNILAPGHVYMLYENKVNQIQFKDDMFYTNLT